MLERAFAWVTGENLLIFGGLAFALLSLACEAGFRLGAQQARRRPDDRHDRAGVGTISASMMGLLSFTLGLTIGYAQDRAEARRVLVVHEANAIETAWLRAKLVGGEVGHSIDELIEEFAKVELAFTVAETTEPEAGLLARRGALQDRIWELMQTVVRDDPTSMANPLTNALNEMFDSALSQRFAFEGRAPPTLSWMLLCGALLAIGAMGYQFGLSNTRHLVLVVLLLAMWTGAMMLIVDLNRPRHGSIRVDPAPLMWTIEGFAALLAAALNRYAFLEARDVHLCLSKKSGGRRATANSSRAVHRAGPSDYRRAYGCKHREHEATGYGAPLRSCRDLIGSNALTRTIYSESTPSRCELSHLTTPSSPPSTRTVAGDGTIELAWDARSDRRRGHDLQDRVIWRHTKEAAGSKVPGIYLEIIGIPGREFG